MNKLLYKIRAIFLLVFGLLLLIGSILYLLPISYGYKAMAMRSASMSPVMEVGDRFVVDVNAYKNKTPQLNDVVLINDTRNPALQKVSIVAGLPGQSVLLSPHTTFPDKLEKPKPGEPFTVPEGHVYTSSVTSELPTLMLYNTGEYSSNEFLLNNLAAQALQGVSSDAEKRKRIGSIPIGTVVSVSQIADQVEFIYWPFSRFGTVQIPALEANTSPKAP